MKYLNKNFAICCLACLALTGFSSCSDDDDNNTTTTLSEGDQYLQKVLEENGVEFVTKEWLKEHGMPYERSKVLRILDNLGIEYKAK